MPFKRKFDASYPCVYNTWMIEDVTMIIQDLAPEDDEAAIKILKDDMITDEVLCNIQKVIEDPVSTQEILEFWGECLKQRMSIGCYEEKDGKKTLVALNVCIVDCEGEEEQIEFKGEKCKNVNAVMVYAEKIANSFEYTGLPILLHAMGLIVRKESRGRSLGQKILAAREPLCLSQGIKATATVFTGIGSQKLASRVGFETITEFTIRDLAEQGLPYPKDDERVIKYMAWKFK